MCGCKCTPHKYTLKHKHTDTHTRTDKHKRESAYMFVCTYTCKSTHVHTQRHTHKHLHLTKIHDRINTHPQKYTNNKAEIKKTKNNYTGRQTYTNIQVGVYINLCFTYTCIHAPVQPRISAKTHIHTQNQTTIAVNHRSTEKVRKKTKEEKVRINN